VNGKKLPTKIRIRLEVDLIIKLDYSLETPEERKALVEKILEENPEPNE
jgi:hypothetical protein